MCRATPGLNDFFPDCPVIPQFGGAITNLKFSRLHFSLNNIQISPGIARENISVQSCTANAYQAAGGPARFYTDEVCPVAEFQAGCRIIALGLDHRAFVLLNDKGAQHHRQCGKFVISKPGLKFTDKCGYIGIAHDIAAFFEIHPILRLKKRDAFLERGFACDLPRAAQAQYGSEENERCSECSSMLVFLKQVGAPHLRSNFLSASASFPLMIGQS